MSLHVNCLHAASTAGRSSTDARITRRGFLSLCAAGYTRVAFGDASSSQPRNGGLTWALISDTHISASAEKVVRGSCMAENLHRAVAEVRAAGVDHVLFDGDVAFASGKPADYARFLDITAPLARAATPLHFTLGNHDHRGNFRSALRRGDAQPVEGKALVAAAAGGVRWIMLDSLDRVNGGRGSLGEPQRSRLAQLLDGSPDIPTLVCLHHNPERTLRGLRDYPAFLDIVRPRRQVKAVVFAHTHEYRVWSDGGLHFLNLPALGYRHSKTRALGWVLAHLRPAGMAIQFHALDRNSPLHGTSRWLAWRSDARL